VGVNRGFGVPVYGIPLSSVAAFSSLLLAKLAREFMVRTGASSRDRFVASAWIGEKVLR
jgi:hypothetical protein